MHQTRNETTMQLPIERKGTKYVVRASSHFRESVPVLIAVRDMLKLARTAKEVGEMIKVKSLKLNGRIVLDYHEAIKLFGVFDADKRYVLTLLPSKRFTLVENKKDTRLCKVVGKRLVKNGSIQINLHDGTNVITKDKIKINDSVYVDFENKIKKHISLEKGREVFVFSGKHMGMKGKIESMEGKKVMIKFDKEDMAKIDTSHVIAE